MSGDKWRDTWRDQITGAFLISCAIKKSRNTAIVKFYSVPSLLNNKLVVIAPLDWFYFGRRLSD